MRYKGIIFDLDGVICSTDEYHYQAWKALANEIGASDFSRADNARQRGVSRMESLEVVLEKAPEVYTEAEKQALADRKNRLYQELLSNMSPADLPDEVCQTLDTLRRRGLLLAIGSSSKNAPLILERIGLRNYFDQVADGNQITHSKPHPEGFLLAARLLGLEPRDCLAVEDAEAGIEAGQRGGFDTAGIGPAAECGRAAYELRCFSDLLTIAKSS